MSVLLFICLFILLIKWGCLLSLIKKNYEFFLCISLGLPFCCLIIDYNLCKIMGTEHVGCCMLLSVNILISRNQSVKTTNKEIISLKCCYYLLTWCHEDATIGGNLLRINCRWSRFSLGAYVVGSYYQPFWLLVRQSLQLKWWMPFSLFSLHNQKLHFFVIFSYIDI